MEKIVGSLPITNTMALVIKEIVYDTDDYVVAYFTDGEKISRKTKNKILYTKDGEAYFIKNGTRYFLNSFIHT